LTLYNLSYVIVKKPQVKKPISHNIISSRADTVITVENAKPVASTVRPSNSFQHIAEPPGFDSSAWAAE
jgi:hypothetical protein